MPQETKGKPHRHKKRKHMNPFLYLILVVTISAILAGVIWMMAGDVLALNKPTRSAVITLSESVFTKTETTDKDGQPATLLVPDMKYVADQLKEKGLVEYEPLFQLFCAVTKVKSKGKLMPGTYELNTDMDYNALVNALSAKSGNRVTVTVTIPEGYILDQIFELLEEKGVLPAETLKATAANYDFKFSFLKGVLPLGDYHRLEGYLFPDTYEFYMGGGEKEAVQVLNKMILRFDEQFTDALREKAANMGYSVHDIVTIASLIEKETDGTDQAHIASVIYNRLKNPSYETVGLLQIDAALVYALGRNITAADYNTASTPYNTYLYKGLPPGPIAAPGMVALNAALNPSSTKDYYYVLGSDKLHHFFRTHNEQLAYIAKLNAGRS